MSDRGFSYTGDGTNSSGNHYCSRDYGNGSNSFHYSNTDGSYYYSNPDGSKYYNNGNGGSTYTSTAGNRHSLGRAGTIPPAFQVYMPSTQLSDSANTPAPQDHTIGGHRLGGGTDTKGSRNADLRVTHLYL